MNGRMAITKYAQRFFSQTQPQFFRCHAPFFLVTQTPEYNGPDNTTRTTVGHGRTRVCDSLSALFVTLSPTSPTPRTKTHKIITQIVRFVENASPAWLLARPLSVGIWHV